MKKVWKVKDKGYCSDESLISFIKMGKVCADDFIISDLLDDYIQVKDTIYSFYLGGN